MLATTPRKSSFSVFDRIAEILLAVVAVVGVQVQVVILMENLIFDTGISCSFGKEKKLTVHICYLPGKLKVFCITPLAKTLGIV